MGLTYHWDNFLLKEPFLLSWSVLLFIFLQSCLLFVHSFSCRALQNILHGSLKRVKKEER